jgi:hypothetical protein
VDKTISKALKTAFTLGKTYFMQAESRSFANQRRSDETLAKFRELETSTMKDLYSAVPPREALIELLIATRTQSEGVTADLIIKLLSAGKETHYRKAVNVEAETYPNSVDDMPAGKGGES